MDQLADPSLYYPGLIKIALRHVTLESGTKLGRYEIRSKIGSGGMGKVYRARDEKLNRDVAIKVLPTTLSANGERLHWFEQEAQADASNPAPVIVILNWTAILKQK
jgi:serine/threonine protein kinase